MLGVLANCVLNGIDKSLGFDQALAKESLECFPADKDVNLVFYLILVLLSAEQGGIFQKNSRKQNSVWAHSTGYGKVIFALLEKIVII